MLAETTPEHLADAEINKASQVISPRIADGGGDEPSENSSSTALHSATLDFKSESSQVQAVRRPSSRSGSLAIEQLCYYRILVSGVVARESALHEAPEVDSLPRRAAEVIAVSHLVKSSESNATFLKLQHGEGWLFDIDENGSRVAEVIEGGKGGRNLANQVFPHLMCGTVILNLWDLSLCCKKEPAVQEGLFYYKVLRDVKVRAGPDYGSLFQEADSEAQRTKLVNTVIEASQLVRYPGSPMTFIKLAYEHGWIFDKLPDGEAVLQMVDEVPQPVAKESFYLVRIPVGVREHPSVLSARTGGGYGLNSVLETEAELKTPASTMKYLRLKHGKGWVFESLEDGREVLQRLPDGTMRDVGTKFYRTLSDVTVLARPELGSETLKRRPAKTLAECSESLRLGGTPYTFAKLAHDDGWIMEKVQDESSLELVPGEAEVIDGSEWYEIQLPVVVRTGPDLLNPGTPGISSKSIGTTLQCDRVYKPPQSHISFLRLENESGWIMDRTLDGRSVIKKVKGGSKRFGKYFFRTLEETYGRTGPDFNSTAIRKLGKHTMLEFDCMVTLPSHGKPVFVRLAAEPVWVAVKDTAGNSNLERVSESIFALYNEKSKWLALGYPERSWYRVPEESNTAVLAEEGLLATKMFDKKERILGAVSLGRDEVPLKRRGYFTLNGKKQTVDIEEFKHAASNTNFSFAWKQIWWVFELDGVKYGVEVQHGLRGGFREVKLNGQTVLTQRSITSVVWDSGSTHEFSVGSHLAKVIITLEGSFFSLDLQYYSYRLVIDGAEMLQTSFDDEDSENHMPAEMATNTEGKEIEA